MFVDQEAFLSFPCYLNASGMPNPLFAGKLSEKSIMQLWYRASWSHPLALVFFDGFHPRFVETNKL